MYIYIGAYICTYMPKHFSTFPTVERTRVATIHHTMSVDQFNFVPIPQPSDFGIKKVSSSQGKKVADECCNKLETNVRNANTEMQSIAKSGQNGNECEKRTRACFKKLREKITEIEDMVVNGVKSLPTEIQSDVVYFVEKVSIYIGRVLDWMLDALTLAITVIVEAVKFVFGQAREIFVLLKSLI